MKVILLQNIKNFGRMGDIKNVADGYARNFLLPNGKAKIATDKSIKEAEALKTKAMAQNKIRAAEMEKVAEKLKGVTLEFTKKLSKSGTLFDSVNAEEIAQKLSENIGAKIEADMINLNEFQGHIKHAGSHTVPVELNDQLSETIQVNVKEEEETKNNN